jgi:2-phospho-L-lactate/phosphoenolpyruvate guanylyltransferase
MDCIILIPMKGFAGAKQRLSLVLDPKERSMLARAMLDDVLAAFAAWRDRPAVAVVTGDNAVRSVALSQGFDVIEDREGTGETEAIAEATSIAVRLGAASTMVIPADVPLVTAIELEAVLAALPPGAARGSVLVPAADGRGTNAALRRPADLFPLRFGNDSFQPHWRAARAAGHPCAILRPPGVALDVDGPADVAALLRQPVRTGSQRLLLAWKLPERLRAIAAPASGAPATS